jgi:hypothetical protein
MIPVTVICSKRAEHFRKSPPYVEENEACTVPTFDRTGSRIYADIRRHGGFMPFFTVPPAICKLCSCLLSPKHRHQLFNKRRTLRKYNALRDPYKLPAMNHTDYTI